MSWMESQVDTRARLDAELVERAYAELASSVTDSAEAPSFAADDLTQTFGAVRTCLRYCRAEPGNVPEDVEDVETGIEWLCRPSGTMTRKVQLTQGWYKNATGAMLGCLKTGEFVALLPAALGGYYFHHPRTGKKVRVNAEVAKQLDEWAVFFYRSLPNKALGIRDLLGFVWSLLDRSDYMLVIFAALVASLVGLLPAWANKVAFDTVVPSGQPGLILPMAGLLLGVTASNVVIGMFRNLIMTRVTSKLSIMVESATFSRVLMLPASFFRDYASGNLANRVSQIQGLMNLLISLQLGTGLSLLLSLVYVAQIFAFTPALVVPAIIVALVQAAFTVIVALVSARRQRAAMRANAENSGMVTALLNGISKIKMAGAEDRAFARWAHNYAAYARANYNVPLLELALPALVTLTSVVGTATIFFMAGTAQVALSDYMAFNVAFGQVTAAVGAIAGSVVQVAQIGPILELVKPILDAVPETSEDKPSVESLTGGIEVLGVSFRYEEDAPYVLQDLSFKVRPGEYVAIVGRSGCGKSTILRLMLGFEKPEQGTILYGPHDVSKVDLRSLRQAVGTVMQNGRLFMGDIFSNITISAPTATMDDAWEAAEIAGIADDIRKMPMGMQTMVTEGGGGISGGQRQRIMIARAVCGKRRILMLDEATSALDNITQKHVADALAELKCTRIVVAHRLSTVRHCDRILVVDHGHIAEEGTYEQLIERGGIFAELVERQRLD